MFIEQNENFNIWRGEKWGKMIEVVALFYIILSFEILIRIHQSWMMIITIDRRLSLMKCIEFFSYLHHHFSSCSSASFVVNIDACCCSMMLSIDASFVHSFVRSMQMNAPCRHSLENQHAFNCTLLSLSPPINSYEKRIDNDYWCDMLFFCLEFLLSFWHD